MTIRPANLEMAETNASPDLRRIGAHPDYWYPVAWSHELKPDKTFAN